MSGSRSAGWPAALALRIHGDLRKLGFAAAGMGDAIRGPLPVLTPFAAAAPAGSETKQNQYAAVALSWR